MKNLIDIYNKIVDFDFIGFPCALEYYKCYGKEIKPSSHVMISRKNNILMKLCKDELSKMIYSYNYTSYNFNNYGNCVLLKYLDDSINKFGMKYLQLSIEYNGITDYNNKIITSENLLSKNETNFLKENNVYLYFINRDEITKNFKYNWFDRFSIDQIIGSNLWINKLFSKSFKFDNKYYYLPIFEDCNYQSENCNCDISFGRFNCTPSNTISLNDYDKIKEYNLPPKNKVNLINMLQNCNYFSTPPWLTIYNSSTKNN